MKNKSISACLGTRGYTKFTILSYAISILLASSDSTAVWAEAPETSKIVFMSKRDGNPEIYIMNPDGSEQVNLTQHPAADYQPAWSPNGKHILFSSDRDGIFDLYLMDADGTNVRKVFTNSKYRWEPAWSPDGKRIAYAQGDPGKAKLQAGLRFVPYADLTLCIATANGDSVRKLTEGFNPSWSLDGQQIVYVVGGLKHMPLGIYDLRKHSKDTLLLKEMPWAFDPVWSSRDNRIVFTKLNDAMFNGQGFLAYRSGTIHTVNSDGTGLHQITNEEDNAHAPTWSPHSDELIFSMRVGFPQLFKSDQDGHNATQLTDDGSNTSPDWFDPFYSVLPSVPLLTTMWGKIKTD
jgi:Tol biopolymer transport system component